MTGHPSTWKPPIVVDMSLTTVEARLIRRYHEELGVDLNGIRTREGRVVPVE